MGCLRHERYYVSLAQKCEVSICDVGRPLLTLQHCLRRAAGRESPAVKRKRVQLEGGLEYHGTGGLQVRWAQGGGGTPGSRLLFCYAVLIMPDEDHTPPTFPGRVGGICASRGAAHLSVNCLLR